MLYRLPNPANDPSLSDFDPRFEQISAYLDGELSPDEAASVEALLSADPQARQMFSELRILQDSFDRIPAADEDVAAVDRLVNQVLTRIERPPARLRWRLGQTAAALVLMAGSGWWAWRWAEPQPLVSVEDPPVKISSAPRGLGVAGRYLLQPSSSKDPYTILFVESGAFN